MTSATYDFEAEQAVLGAFLIGGGGDRSRIGSAGSPFTSRATMAAAIA